MTQEPTEAAQVTPTCFRHPERESHIRCQRCERPICPDCMRPAAVGFQCPECVKEGAKSTRQARTPFGGTRTSDSSLVSRVLVFINLAVFGLILLTGWKASPWIDRLALHPQTVTYRENDGTVTTIRGVASSVFGEGGAWWQPVTSMFTHVELWHIAFNLLALWVLGPQLETLLGRWRFLALYFISGLAGSAAVYWWSEPFSATLGASGALFGLMGGLLVVALKVKGDVRGIATWIGVSFVYTFLFMGSISWQGHLGGFLGGLAAAFVLVYAPRERRLLFQLLGLGALSLVLVAAFVVRTVTLHDAVPGFPQPGISALAPPP